MSRKLKKSSVSMITYLIAVTMLIACNLPIYMQTASDDLPDLEITYVSITSEISTCESDNILGTRIWIANNGDSDVDGFNILVNGTAYAVQDTVPANGSISVWFSGYHNAPEIILDDTDEIPESDESNNTFSQQIPVPTLIPPCTPNP